MPKYDQTSPILNQCLDDLEARIDLQAEQRLLMEWIDFSEGRFPGQIFSPARRQPAPSQIEWPQVSINAALASYECMAIQQYGACSRLLEEGSGLLLNVRCNYGTGIVPSLFGMPIFLMDEAYDTLPTSRPLNNLDAIKLLLDSSVPDLYHGYGRQVFEMAEYFQSIAQHYPKISQTVSLYHPDTQGPMDICELIWGSSIFYALYDRPDLVKALLELVTETYIRFMRLWVASVPFRQGGNIHWGLYHRGNLMLRDDSAMNLSPDMYGEFIRPYDQRLLDEFGGGAIHFCGKGHHYLPQLSQMNGVFAVNLSQPEYNSMELVYANTVDKGINLLDLKREAAETALAAGRDLRGRVHAW